MSWYSESPLRGLAARQKPKPHIPESPPTSASPWFCFSCLPPPHCAPATCLFPQGSILGILAVGPHLHTHCGFELFFPTTSMSVSSPPYLFTEMSPSERPSPEVSFSPAALSPDAAVPLSTSHVLTGSLPSTLPILCFHPCLSSTVQA